MASQSNPERFVQLFIAQQRRLLAYACALVGDVNAAEDVVSEATEVMWRKFDEFDPATDFGAWASTIVRYKAMDHHRRQRRDSLVLDDDLFELVADQADAAADRHAEEFEALQVCLGKLRREDRELLMKRYSGQTSVGSLAESIGRSTVTLRKMLIRIQRGLLGCIDERLKREDSSI